VFFGLGKWGKLINISEGGMTFEFYHPPPTDQPITFGLEVMGREPSEPSGKLATDSVHADGQVIWTHDFERCAGVQFVDISEATRKRIRQWLCVEPSSGAAVEGAKVRCDAIETELRGRPLPVHEATNQRTDEGQLWNDELAQSSNPKVLCGPGTDEQPTLEDPSGAKSQIGLAAPMSMARWVALLAILSGITTMILSPRVHLAALFESLRARSTGNSAPLRAEVRSVAKGPPVFQVEAVDMNNRRRLLTFENDVFAVDGWLSSGGTPSRTPNKHFLINPASPAESTTTERRPSLSSLNLGKPTVTRPVTNASTEDSTLAFGSGVPSSVAIRPGDPSGAILPNTSVPVPAPPAPVGGQVQEAILLSSVPPTYPVLARSVRLQGEVTIDALIDSTGKVADMKPLSGPVALQQAAMDALRQWKYEPARLDGQPVSTHLSVTIKFRLN
jgi:periplasmic protein TonB